MVSCSEPYTWWGFNPILGENPFSWSFYHTGLWQCIYHFSECLLKNPLQLPSHINFSCEDHWVVLARNRRYVCFGCCNQKGSKPPLCLSPLIKMHVNKWRHVPITPGPPITSTQGLRQRCKLVWSVSAHAIQAHRPTDSTAYPDHRDGGAGLSLVSCSHPAPAFETNTEIRLHPCRSCTLSLLTIDICRFVMTLDLFNQGGQCYCLRLYNPRLLLFQTITDVSFVSSEVCVYQVLRMVCQYRHTEHGRDRHKLNPRSLVWVLGVVARYVCY